LFSYCTFVLIGQSITFPWRTDCHQFSGTMSPCRKRVQNMLKSGNPRRHVPWCKVDGSYNLLQCYGSYCYCVSENGYEQPGTKINVALGRPLCTRTGKFLETYQPKKLNVYIYQQYKNTVRSSLTFSKARAFPFLFYVGGTVSECQRKNQEALSKPNQNRFLPRCKSDGRYEEVQCQSSSGECWCVDQEGKEIPRTRTAKILKCPVIGEVYSARTNIELFQSTFFEPCISVPVKSKLLSL